MNHLPILPVLLPALTGTLMLLPPLSKRLKAQRWITWSVLILLMAIGAMLVLSVQRQTVTYALGGWQPPFGIVLVVDRLAALLLVVTAVLAFCAGIYSADQEDRQSSLFYPLFLFQVMGINGAFLTGDLFNLFVFFEILLIASYALLIHGGGREKTKAGFHYVSLNLIGSALFLVALGTLYGTMGSLNMADMSVKVGFLLPEDQILAKTGGLLLLLVFSLKSALLPLHFWLPKTYTAASASVVALFAVMTKVGFYSICRVFGGIFGSSAGALANFAIPWIWPLAIATIALGSIGVYAATSLRILTANLVIVSVGTLLITFVIEGGQSLLAGFYYLPHSTAVTAALFLIADQIGTQRGVEMDRFVKARPVTHATLLGSVFLIAAIAAIGLPPLSGFVGKLLILHSASRFAEQVWVWPALLASSLMTMIAFSRAGSTFFWHVSAKEAVAGLKVRFTQIAAIFILLSTTAVMTVFADAILTYSQDAAEDLRRDPTVIQRQIETSRSDVHGVQES
ncbi:MAG: monovalent cation/H+ antiporter subunit D [Desulfobacterales bacterium]|jgi:multicomponent K+:H+ antiporter subunit D